MGANIRKDWDHGQVDLTSNSIAYLITKVRGGESVTIKAKAANSGIVYLGKNKDVSSSNGFDVSKGEVAMFTLPATFGQDNEIEIWAIAATSGDDISFFKLMGLFPQAAASGTRS